MKYLLIIGFLLLEGIACVSIAFGQNGPPNGFQGGIGAGTYMGGLGGGMGMGYIAGTVGSAPSPPTCGAANGQLDFSFCSDAVYYMVGMP